MSDFIINPICSGGSIIPVGGMKSLTTSSCHYEVIDDRLYIAYYQSDELEYDCDVKYDFNLISYNVGMITNDNGIKFTLGDICCDICDFTYDRGFVDGDGGWYCMTCFSYAILLDNTLKNISTTYNDGVCERKLLVNNYDNNYEHMHLGYIVDNDGCYILHFINKPYYVDRYSCYYKLNNDWKNLYVGTCDMCHGLENNIINGSNICQNCHKFVATRFLRENAVKAWFLREICAKDIVLDIYYLIMDKFIGLLRL